MRKLGLLLTAASVMFLAACGGGSSSSGGGGGSTITSVTASCSPATVTSGQTSQCSATVMGTGSFNSGVTWTATAGSISASGLFTAPVVTTSLVVTVTATSMQDATKSGTATVTVNPTTAAVNVQPLIVDAGPEPQTFVTANEAFTTVTVCVPGTTACQTIDHVLVDTGSSGLRLLSGVLTISLPQSNDTGGNPLDECLVFVDGFVWGPVASADITIAGESASMAPVQIMIPATTAPPVPGSCSSQTTGANEGDSVESFGANGILGVGPFQQDCGLYCTTANPVMPPFYYDCPPSGCTPTYVTLAQQVPNPVTMFASDNNGVLIQLPSVPDGGSPTLNGSLIFGIGTQSNNKLDNATVYDLTDSGTFTTVFAGLPYPGSFIDSGSNGLFFLNSSILGVPATCTGQNSSWYCPSTSPDNLSAGNQGTNMTSPVTVTFSIENADNLFSGTNSAFSTLGGPQCTAGSNMCAFDWGLAFFYGRNVFTAIDGMSTPSGTGPYFAY